MIFNIFFIPLTTTIRSQDYGWRYEKLKCICWLIDAKAEIQIFNWLELWIQTFFVNSLSLSTISFGCCLINTANDWSKFANFSCKLSRSIFKQCNLLSKLYTLSSINRWKMGWFQEDQVIQSLNIKICIVQQNWTWFYKKGHDFRKKKHP